MSDVKNLPNIDLPKLLEGMDNEEAIDFVASMLNEQTKEKFLQGRRVDSLRKKYDEEMAAVKVGTRTPQFALLRQREEIRAKYRAKGLQV